MTLFIIETILFMLAGIGALLIGFEMLSNSITKIFHTQLKSLFNKTSKNAIVSVLIGAAATAIVQSSGATTIMVVGFVNTGIIDLFQATSLIMGANIGTTITGQIAALSGSVIDVGAIALGLTGIGALIGMFTKNEKVKCFGDMLAGLGLLFLGLECMSIAIGSKFEMTVIENGLEVTKNVPVIKDAIKNILASDWVSSTAFAPFILFALGIVFTALTQSSSLITSIVITFVANGIYIGAGPDATSLTNNVLFLILGSNIGSCVTALLSSMGATTNAKRASIIHILFNTAGSIIFMILLLLWPKFMEVTFANWFAGNPGTQIAMFHTFFNVVGTIMFLPFIKIFVKVAKLIIKDKEEDKATEVSFIDDRLLSTPSIAVHQVRNEISHMYQKSINILNEAIDGFLNKNLEVREKVDKINGELEVTNKHVIEYMVKLNTVDMVIEDESKLSSFHKSLNDVLRIGEIAENICKYTKQTVNNNLEFSSSVMLHIGFMKNKINALYEKTDEIFTTKSLVKLPDADSIESEIDEMRKQMIDDHMERLNKGECNPGNSGVFVNIVNNLERAADHMIYIAYSVKEAKEQFSK